jgi:polyisoprenoid-binding protein YceI
MQALPAGFAAAPRFARWGRAVVCGWASGWAAFRASRVVEQPLFGIAQLCLGTQTGLWGLHKHWSCPMKKILSTAALATLLAAPVIAETYVLDASHSQIVFSYNHLGFSTSYGMFSGFDGEIDFDQTDPAASSVTVSFPVRTMLTGWEGRFNHFMSADFFDAADDEMVSFTSTAIEVTGDTTALITGDLTLNGVTKSVVLDATLNQAGMHPMENKAWAGFNATTTLLRSDFNVGNFAPFVSDEVEVMISIEAMQAE